MVGCMKIYDRIRMLREQAGLSQADLAALCGYKGRQMISQIENGKIDLPLSKVEVIANALDVAPIYLAGFAERQENMDHALELSNLIDKAYELDEKDRARIAERIDMLLEQEKYNEG